MAINGVLRPGHVQLRVLDLDEGVHFYKNVLGLLEVGRDDSGRVYFRAWDERDHHSVVIRQADTAGLDFFAFKVLDNDTMNKLEMDLQQYGLVTYRKPAGEMLETGERVAFNLPSGHEIELYADKTATNNPPPNPAPWSEYAEKGIAPIRMDHGLLYGPNIAEVKKIFTEVLGFDLVERTLTPDAEGEIAIWLTCSNKAHDIAFVEHENPGKLHHVAFLLETWEKVLRAADIMSMNDISIDIGPTRHGITRGCTIYAWDPSGNRFETFMGGYQTYPDMEPITWTFEGFGAGGGLDYAHRKLHDTFLTVVT